MEQGLEVEQPEEEAPDTGNGGRSGRQRKQRRGGNGRGDAVRLSTRETLRRVVRQRERHTCREHPQRPRQTTGDGRMPERTSARGELPRSASAGGGGVPQGTRRVVDGRRGDDETRSTRKGERPQPRCPQPGEPHGRLQGATNLQSDARRKPPKPGGTARAERVRALAGSSRREANQHGSAQCSSHEMHRDGTCGSPGVDAHRECRRRGDLWTTP